MYFQEKLKEFVKFIFPDLYNVGSEIERQTRSFVSNFLVAYLAYYDSKFTMNNSFEYIIGDIKLSGYDIKEITNTLGTVNELAKILPLGRKENYDNIIVKHVIGKLYKGVYYKEKSFIASFTNAYLFKIGYYTREKLLSAAGADLTMVENLLTIMNSLDSIINNDTEASMSEQHDEVLV